MAGYWNFGLKQVYLSSDLLAIFRFTFQGYADFELFAVGLGTLGLGEGTLGLVQLDAPQHSVTFDC